MKAKLLALATAVMALAFTSCDDTTEFIGKSLGDTTDNIQVVTDTFSVGSKSIMAESVLSRSAKGYLGRIKDSETGSEITANMTSQFYVLDNYTLPEKTKILSKDAQGNPQADSCEILLYYYNYYGDSLAPMKVTAYELEKPIEENTEVLSNFNPEKNGYVRSGGLTASRTYTLDDQEVSDSIKKSSTRYLNIKIRLNDPYTDKAGKVYNNYGSYIMQKFYENPNDFRNLYKFLHDICPGFYFKITNGLGAMTRIEAVQLAMFYQEKADKKPKTMITHLTSTEEVLLTTNFDMNRTELEKLAKQPDRTYLKTPAGLFTELQLPIDDIIAKHKNDTINSARLELRRINSTANSKYNLDIPQNVLILPADSVGSFFAKNKIPDNKTSFLAIYSSKTNSYEFANIAGLVSYFVNNRATASSNPNWGKVVVVPVEVKTTTNDQGILVLNKVSHYMGMANTGLLGGDRSLGNIKMSVVYTRFNGR